jgi:hypothetical protein
VSSAQGYAFERENAQRSKRRPALDKMHVKRLKGVDALRFRAGDFRVIFSETAETIMSAVTRRRVAPLGIADARGRSQATNHYASSPKEDNKMTYSLTNN